MNRMSELNKAERERRRYIRLDLSEDIRAVDSDGRDLGRVERVGAGGVQIRLASEVSAREFIPGAQFELSIVEPGSVRNDFKVEVRVCDGDLLGVQFLNRG
jgi:hypothetical protein